MFKKSKALTFFLSWIPGVGHLYLGLNKLGLQLLIATFASISLIPSFPLVFPFVLTIVWFYSLFDALQKVTLINYYVNGMYRQDPNELDIVQPSAYFDQDLVQTMFKNNTINPLWLGVCSVIIGTLVLVRVLVPEAWSWLLQKNTSSVILALVMIAFGGWQLKKQITKKS